MKTFKSAKLLQIIDAKYLSVFIIIIMNAIFLLPRSTADQTASPTTLTPNYRDSEIPQIQSFATTVSKSNDQLTVAVELNVKIKSNTLNAIEVNLSPRTSNLSLNPKLIPPCVKLGSIKAQSLTVGGEMQSLQSRTKTSDGWYIERHVVTLISKLPLVLYPTAVPTYQDLCDGQYLINTIVLKDAASHTLTITANAASTAPIPVTNTTQSATTSSMATSKYLDTPIMQADFWVDGFAMPCVSASNLAPISTTTTVNGKSTTTTTAAKSPTTIRSTCNQSIDFSKIYINASGDTNGGIGSSVLPIVDYASQAKNALQENLQLKKTVDSLQQRLTNFESGKKPTIDSTTASTPLPIIDYKAKAESLQKQVESLSSQLKRLGVTPTTTGQIQPSTKLVPSISASPRAYPSYSPRARHTIKPKVTPKVTTSPKKK